MKEIAASSHKDTDRVVYDKMTLRPEKVLLTLNVSLFAAACWTSS